MVIPEYIVTHFKGIQKAAGSAIEVIHNDGSKLKDVTPLAQSVDVAVIYAGFDFKDEGEAIVAGIGGDRKFMTLKPKDIALIEAVAAVTPKVVVVMHAGGSIITESWRERVGAILMQWYGGMEGGTALGEILFGDVNPSAKTPCTFPKSEEQLPFFDLKAITATYGYYHGYRFIDKYNHTPRYPFGYGLSYTTFTYTNAQVDSDRITADGTIGISVEVSNTGNRSGDEIVQVYIGALGSKVERHVKELKRFKRIPLEPGVTQTVSFNIPARELAFYSVDQSMWIVEACKYKIFVGSSSAADELTEIELEIIE